MAHKMDDYHFCSGKLRPKYCIVKTNACCFNCEHNDKCQSLATEQNRITSGPKLRPCTSANVGVEDVCEFAC